MTAFEQNVLDRMNWLSTSIAVCTPGLNTSHNESLLSQANKTLTQVRKLVRRTPANTLTFTSSELLLKHAEYLVQELSKSLDRPLPAYPVEQ
jgi:hypothetical protein